MELMQKICMFNGVGSPFSCVKINLLKSVQTNFLEVTRQYFKVQVLLAETSMEMSFPRTDTLKLCIHTLSLVCEWSGGVAEGRGHGSDFRELVAQLPVHGTAFR